MSPKNPDLSIRIKASFWEDVYEGDRVLLSGDHFYPLLSTRPGRMCARAYAYAYRAEAVDEEEGMRVFNEIMKIVGEHEK